jgi:hypothetical protein
MSLQAKHVLIPQQRMIRRRRSMEPEAFIHSISQPWLRLLALEIWRTRRAKIGLYGGADVGDK